MLKFIAIAALLSSVSVFAQDMSRTESTEQSYRDRENGTMEYIGKCTLHQDYEGKKFVVTKVVQDYIEPEESNAAEMAAILAKFDKNLLDLVLKQFAVDSFADADDLTIETLKHNTIKGLNLIRFNVGVGGGNGGYVTVNQVKNGNKMTYKLLAFTFDGDLEYCDKKVWR